MEVIVIKYRTIDLSRHDSYRCFSCNAADSEFFVRVRITYNNGEQIFENLMLCRHCFQNHNIHYCFENFLGGWRMYNSHVMPEIAA